VNEIYSGEEERTFTGILHDITERKVAEKKLKKMFKEVHRSNENLQTTLNMLNLGIVSVDSKGKVKFTNRTIKSLSDKKTAELQDSHWENLIGLDKKDKDTLQAMLRVSQNQTKKITTMVYWGNEKTRWMDIEVKNDPRDTSRKFILLYDMSDIHELRRMLDKNVHFQDLVGKSKPMQDVYQRTRDIANVDWTVLIEGETGTGKELVARAIHNLSHRSNKPFIAVNCAGLTESLLNSQLFGHKKGAFTGAVDDQKGLFESANGGTIFLDEIGDIPINVQTSLLRVLQEHEVTRVGEAKPRKVDVRVLVATNRNLAEEVAQKRFRADLLYRIRVARISLPHLYKRREDIPLLAEAFLAESRIASGKPIEHISNDAMHKLLEYNWPGNVRELKSAIEYAFISCRTTIIEVDNLPPELLESFRGHTADMSLMDERSRIAAALQQTGGNRVKAAKLLGMSRATFYRRLDALDIDLSG
jgi:transcriptional regulator with PAS, ATPase and Fis domain